MLLWILLLNAIISLSLQAYQCTHPIFCNIQILDAVSNSSYFPDSKTFMDQILTVPIEKALYMFKTVPLNKFLSDCFANPDSILIKTTLNDFKEVPQSFSKITKPSLRSFALELNKRWNQLARKVNLNFEAFSTCKQNCSTFLPEMDKQTIIIPGDKFRQSYYWDTFWIVKGLIACDMLQSSQILARNLLLMVKKYGFVPYGFRLYYMNRTQPPFFGLIVKQIAQAYRKKGLPDKAEAFQKQCFDYIWSDINIFWGSSRMSFVVIQQKFYIIFLYFSQVQIPRWQSYKQDIKIASDLSQQQKKKLYRQINTMAQSGWKFSSRWFANKTDIKTANITSLVPTDLNTMIGLTAQYLYDLAIKFKYSQAQNLHTMIELYKKYFNAIKEEGQIYPDYKFYSSNQADKNQDRDVYPSDFYPYLFLNEKLTQNPFQTLVSPSTSQTKTGQQWDKPNVWAPNNWLLHQILVDSQAKKVAQQWVNTVYCGWKKTGNIYEKYRDDVLGERGEGGQYEVQTGFGWTNGLALYYLVKYGDTLSDPPC